MSFARLAVVVLVAFVLGGCAASRIVVEDLPINVARGAPSREPVPVYEAGYSRPPRGAIPFANMGAHGNGYATKESLRADLARRAAQLGADCIFVTGSQINDGGSVTSYGNGLAITQPMKFLSLYAQACVWSPVRIGMACDKDSKITDVIPGSPSEKAGVKIGDRLLAIGGQRTTGDPGAFYRAIAASAPGQMLQAELVAPDNNTRTVSIKCEAND